MLKIDEVPEGFQMSANAAGMVHFLVSHECMKEGLEVNRAASVANAVALQLQARGLYQKLELKLASEKIRDRVC